MLGFLCPTMTWFHSAIRLSRFISSCTFLHQKLIDNLSPVHMACVTRLFKLVTGNTQSHQWVTEVNCPLLIGWRLSLTVSSNQCWQLIVS